jgi:hypothetical protein
MSVEQVAIYFPTVEEDIKMRIDAALIHEALTPVERAVLECLMQGHPTFGRQSTMTIAYMQSMCVFRDKKSYSPRSIKGAVKSLLEVYNIPIGSSRTPGDCGYWVIVSDEEAEEASRPLRNEIFSMFRRLAIISPKSAFVRKLNGQIELLRQEAP